MPTRNFANADVRPFISDICVEFGKCRSDHLPGRCDDLCGSCRGRKGGDDDPVSERRGRSSAEKCRGAGRCRCGEDDHSKDLTGETLASEIKKLIETPETINEMESAARHLGRPDAAEATVDIIEELKRNA